MGPRPRISPRPWRSAATLVTAVALPVAGILVLAPAAQPGTPPGLGAFYAQRIAWRACGPELARELKAAGVTPPQEDTSRFECGTLKVPKIYAVPDRGTFELAMLRVPATGALGEQRERRALVLNFGGPGESGVEGLAAFADGLGRLNTVYDLVGHDPRGVGRSAPVRCGEPAEADWDELDHTPDTTPEAVTIARAEELVNETCGREAGDVLPWVGTVDSARDLDVMRAALDVEKLDYLGFSYGTKLGANYLAKYPGRAGRFVLDGVMDVTKDPRETALADARAFQLALDSFVADCTADNSGQEEGSCPLGGSAREAGRTLNQLFIDLDSNTMATKAGDLDQDTFVQGIIGALYSKEQGWPALREAFTALADGDGAPLVRLAGGGSGRTSRAALSGASRSASRAPDDATANADDANRAISCRDESRRYAPRDYTRAVAGFREASPLFGDAMAAELLTCTGWPVAGENTANRVRASGAPPALLVSTTRDPATPYAGAAALAGVLANGSRVLTHVGDGHTAYLAGDTCVDSAVEDYLLKGRLPAKGKRCN
ncbi:alpha/beta hydrolase [Streptomyces sp. NPDC051940]|uniref:alpha/beta hydrolase n=1 Tax=Streptomyces sp. NPDC051940 TaxID=3155675 RepID=UPI003418C44F